ncbi:DNA-binding protein [Rubneribacter badeniensis]|uniref:DNA-binding protein n=2 Tax=Rubneribacter badeniensis TaxID=2070688 RepID=A0A2K2U1I7_9ACTN|nr:hypothetical protein B5F41_03170 [Gordonibacter sp. An232A]PNV64183.1 DNA-binding protein [Rubneribacter badeniensis]
MKYYDPNEWISVRMLQEELCVSRSTAYRITKAIPHKTIGRTIRIRRADLEHYLRTHDQIPTNW